MRVVGLLVVLMMAAASVSFAQKMAGSLLVSNAAQPGYTLFTSLGTKNTYLIDNCGNEINRWSSQFTSGSSSYLMKTGNLLRAANISNPVIARAGGGGKLEMMDWDGNLVWTFDYNTPLVRQHHDILPLDNGNVLVLAWQLRTREEALAMGRNDNLIPDDVVWSEEVIEVKPIFPDGFEIVWKWSLWDHLIQDNDASKAGFGVVGDHPELVDVNYVDGGRGGEDWIHANAIDYNPDLDQVMVCSLVFDEFWIIDHSTTTAQAATHTGGTSGKGGDLLYRWGNPRTYRKGTDLDQVLQGPHHAHWIKKDLPSAGSIMVFNNNAGEEFSAVEMINPPISSSGAYVLENGRYGPSTPNVSVRANPAKNLYSVNMSGAEMQPNGNILICPSQQGRFVELTPSLDTAWIYKSPITTAGLAGIDFTPLNSDFKSDPSFRAIKYSPDNPALQGKDLTAGAPLENIDKTGPVECDIVMGLPLVAEAAVRVYPNPTTDFLYIESPDPNSEVDVRLLNLKGAQVASAKGCGSLCISMVTLPDGLFIAMVNGKPTRIMKKTGLE
jgi:hypothetical protein